MMKNKTSILILAVALLFGVIFVVFSGEEVDSVTAEEIKHAFDEGEYERELEERLTQVIEEIDGVGKVSVMVTLEGSALYSYAQDSSEDVTSDGDFKTEASIVLSAKSASVKEAIVSGYTLPKIKGAAVVCEKKLSATVIERVIGVVSASLGISTDKIYVTN